MKIIELKFKNLNSLYGEWHIDFTKPEYTSNGIFALTGPTGAGKSTILDAVCLALYGKTPRLGAVTAGSNEIISRQTGECYSEVVFESLGSRYRCSWEQHRARRNPEGKLTDAKHEISNADSGEIIESKKSLVSSVIESKTGMDYERFTRSILLAQGDFDIFLKADNSQKSRILEQITGTEIYSDISVKVYEKNKEEKEKLKILEAENNTIIQLNPEEIINLNSQLEENIKNEKNISDKISETEKLLGCLTNINELENSIKLLKDDSDILEKEIKIFRPDKTKLEKALKASVFDGDYASLKSRRELINNYKDELNSELDKLPDAENENRKNIEKLSEAEEKLEKLKEERKNLSNLLVKVRSYDQKREDLKVRIEKSGIELENLKNLINEKENIIKNLNKKLFEKKNELKSAELYLENNSDDECLISLLTGIEEQINTAALRNRDLLKKRKEYKDVSEYLISVNKNLSVSEDNLNKNRIHYKEAEDNLVKSMEALDSLLGGRLIREYRSEKELLLKQKNLVDRIIKLEDERSVLEDGKPCPLCGSVSHPYAEGNIPEKDEIEERIEYLENIILSAESQEAIIKNCEKNKNDAAELLSESEKNTALMLSGREAAEKDLNSISEDLKIIESDAEKLVEELSDKLSKFSINEFTLENTEDIISSLKKRMNKWKTYNTDKYNYEKIINEISGDINNQENLLSAHSEIFSEKEKELLLLSSEYENITAERKEIFGEQSADKEETELNNIFTEIENELNLKRNLRDESVLKLNNIKNRIENLNNKIKSENPVLEKMKLSFIKMIKDAGFENETVFKESVLSPSDRDILSLRAKELDERAAEINSSLKDRKKRLDEETAKLTVRKELYEIQDEYEEYKRQQKQLIDETAGIRHKLAENSAAGERIKEKQREINSQKSECEKWENLNKYIGSANGNKYREFAQGITFEIMVSHANRQLEKMSDRYILLRSSDAPLELDVADNYQAGEIRSVKNLSGGESFIVSLSLALGLSKMAGRKVRIDSLFLDEGFGTLDEDSLETALETLSSLQQDGKLIGVISHVQALKERISTQIEITPVSGGRSILSGPGCSSR